MLSPTHAKWAILILCPLLLFLTFQNHHLPPSLAKTNRIGTSSTTTSPSWLRGGAKHPSARPRPRKPDIPNIVHFVHLARDTTNPVIRFDFRQFIAVYSASLYLRPDVIYIHTDYDRQAAAAAKTSMDSYTQAISNLPNVRFNHVVAPNQTTTGQPIRLAAHKADFIRIKMLKQHGGIYLDDDAYVLKDMASLRYMGFQNVLGMEDDEPCNAVMMASPNNDLMSTMDELQDRVFDGAWTTHSVVLLTTLRNDFALWTNQVLTLSRNAFFPLNWLRTEMEILYSVHDDRGTDIVANQDPHDRPAFVAEFHPTSPRTWQVDFRPSYVVHGWTHNLYEFADWADILGGFGAITPAYVLSRRSNLARAVYPALKHALDNKVLVLRRPPFIDSPWS